MTTITITRNAKCKDCKFIQPIFIGLLKRHECSNPKSPHYRKKVRLNDLVCGEWKL